MFQVLALESKVASRRGSTVTLTVGAGARRQVDLLEAGQAARRFPARTALRPDIDLRHVLAGGLAGVGDLEADGQLVAGRRWSSGRCSRRSSRTGRGRRRTAAGGPSGRTTCSRPPRPRCRSRRRPSARAGVLSPSITGRGHLVGAGCGKVIGRRPDGLTSPVSTRAIGLAAAGAGVPGLDHGADLGQPRHQHRAAGFQDHGGLGVGGGDGVDQARPGCRPGSGNSPADSAAHWWAKTIARSAPAAALAAAAGSEPSS